jgi:3-hydroxybutyryl-CoA dehydratase
MLAVGHKFPETRFGPVSTRQVAAYAEVSGDDNPIHSDSDMAHSFGFAAPLIHGMFVMGLIESACREWQLCGDVEEIDSRFVSPVTHGAELCFRGRIAAIETDRLRIRITVYDERNVLCLVGSIALRTRNPP